MLYPSMNQLLKINKHGVANRRQSRYSLVIAVAKHAREIADRADAADERLEDRSVSLAVKDFADGKAYFEEV